MKAQPDALTSTAVLRLLLAVALRSVVAGLLSVGAGLLTAIAAAALLSSIAALLAAVPAAAAALLPVAASLLLLVGRRLGIAAVAITESEQDGRQAITLPAVGLAVVSGPSVVTHLPELLLAGGCWG